MLPFLIRVGFERSEFSFSQVISGRGEPVAAHSKVAELPSSAATSLGWIENAGFQITVVKNDNCLLNMTYFSPIRTENTSNSDY